MKLIGLATISALLMVIVVLVQASDRGGFSFGTNSTSKESDSASDTVKGWRGNDQKGRDQYEADRARHQEWLDERTRNHPYKRTNW